ncbi:MAG TPA: TolC family protein [Kiritimatiellia bacterium]|nr:TolC family protein [Kiritimatiellia bacterium]
MHDLIYKKLVSWLPRAVVVTMTLYPAAIRAEGAETFTLEQCLARGHERSIAAANARREQRIAEADIRRIRAQVYPSLDATAQYSRLDESMAFPGVDLPDNRNQYYASVTAEQLVYSGGSVRAALRAASSYRRQAEEESNRTDAALTRDIRRAFYLVLFHEAAVEVSRQSVEQLAKLEAEARLKFESGALSEFEWLSARVSLANERPRLMEAENQRQLARSALRNLLYLEHDHWNLSHQWRVAPLDATLEEFYQAGRENRWELHQARVNLDILEADIKVTEGEYLPEVKLFATYHGSDPSENNYGSDGWDWRWTAGVRANWNLFDGGARGSTRMEKLLKREMAGDSITDLERAVMLEIETAYRNLQQALNILDGASDTIALAEKALDIARLRFERGLATNLEFTDRNLELNRARIQYLNGMLTYHLALSDLQYASGSPSDHFETRNIP